MKTKDKLNLRTGGTIDASFYRGICQEEFHSASKPFVINMKAVAAIVSIRLALSK